MKALANKKIAIVATNGFEQSELFDPKKAMEKAGAEVQVISSKAGSIKGWDKKDWGKTIAVDLTFAKASAEEFDGLILPGGVMNPDSLRIDDAAIAFIQSFVDAGKPIGAICHGPWTLIETGLVDGKKMTSWPSLKTDLENAGARWFDKTVVVDGNLVTSRKPEDLPAFNEKLIELFGATSEMPLSKTRNAKKQRDSEVRKN